MITPEDVDIMFEALTSELGQGHADGQHEECVNCNNTQALLMSDRMRTLHVASLLELNRGNINTILDSYSICFLLGIRVGQNQALEDMTREASA